jgi:hypothetical protein
MNLLIFKAGEYPQGSWPLERTKKLVASYDPVNNIEACGVVGHMDNGLVERQENELAHAWVKSLSMTEAGEVYAEIPNEEISPQLRGWLADHNLRYISAELGEYDKLPAPNTSAPYLLRIAFLGRSIPQIPTTKIPALFKKMLSAAGFGKSETETDSGVHVARFCRKIDASALTELAALAGHEEKPDPEGATGSSGESKPTAPKQAAFSGGPASSIEEEVPMTEKEQKDQNDELARLKGENFQLKADNASKDTKLAEFATHEAEAKKESAKKDAEVFFGAIRDKGKLTPAQFDQAVAHDVKLGEADRAEFRALFSAAKPVVSLGSQHVATREKAKSEEAASGSLVAEINSFAKKEKITYEEAAKQLHKERPELFSREEE